jgi:hypothetical protein
MLCRGNLHLIFSHLHSSFSLSSSDLITYTLSFPMSTNTRLDGQAVALSGPIAPHSVLDTTPGHRCEAAGVQRGKGTGGGHDMATVMERGVVTTVGRGRPGAGRPSHLPLTLYDLITAIQDVVGPEDDQLVVATVRLLLQSGRLTRCRTGRVVQRASCLAAHASADSSRRRGQSWGIPWRGRAGTPLPPRHPCAGIITGGFSRRNGAPDHFSQGPWGRARWSEGRDRSPPATGRRGVPVRRGGCPGEPPLKGSRGRCR